MVKKIRIRDGCFAHAVGMSAAGDNEGIGPTHFEWCRDEDCDSITTFYTDTNLYRAEQDFTPRKVAWLIEPPSHSQDHYRYVSQHYQIFDAVLTYHPGLLGQNRHNIKFYPHGGSWIHRDKWGLHRKSSIVSMIFSPKITAPGHKLRHAIAKKYGGDINNNDEMHLYGKLVHPLKSKFGGLASYQYSIVIESIKLDNYFSEKLIDCLSVGTVPIYWGCRNIGNFFNPTGIIQFDKISELDAIFDTIGPDCYLRRLDAIQENLERAKQYAIPEDWLYEHYKDLFI